MSDDKHTGLTPLMRQYFAIKNNFPDTILLFQVGDFYELFFDDALKAASVLGIALTQRGTHKGEPIPLCGVPLHVVDHYLSKLVRAGYKVALCDQLEQPKPGKVVERGVTQVLTPGTLTDSKLLDDKSASYLAAFFPIKGSEGQGAQQSWTVLFAELLTGHLFVTTAQTSMTLLEAELQRFMPDEILVPQTKLGEFFGTLFKSQGYVVSYEPYAYNDAIMPWFAQQFPHESCSLNQSDSLHEAFTLLYTYLKRNNEQGLAELKHLSFYRSEDYLMLDAVTQRNLELVKNTHDGSSSSTLFSVLDRAVTAMGSRMIKKWILRPLIKKEHIVERLQAVELFVKNLAFKNELIKLLQPIGDLERIVGRIALRRAQLYDYTALLNAVRVLPSVKQLLTRHVQKDQAPLLHAIAAKIVDLSPLETLLNASLSDDPSKDWLIKQGYDGELDRIRILVEEGSHAILALEALEQKKTGINSLKIRYNQVHGYGIEVTTPNLSMVPAHYLRTQTLANRERFTTQELKNLEHDLQKARHEILHKEKEVFEQVKARVEETIPALKKVAHALAYVDALLGLAETAYVQRYVRPTFNDIHTLDIQDGRHPVVELRLQKQFIPNSAHLDDASSLWLITGPNMGGKSTFLRQVALITLMAQMGSFVPAARAHLSLVDRIFTRIGAADNLEAGKSTFLVEMEETALICHHATKDSLVILDEVGRGTSTYDGLAIAQAVVEYIFTHIKAHCLFATHYHELTSLCERYPGIKPYHAASMKTAESANGKVGSIVLLHKIMPGIADGSFGLEVAALAQLPASLITRAREILTELSLIQHAASHDVKGQHTLQHERHIETKDRMLAANREVQEKMLAAQLAAHNTAAQLAVEQLAQVDCDSLTAKQALELVWRLKESLQ